MNGSLGIIHSLNFNDILTMQKDIHPKYSDVQVVCSCGNKFTTKSTFKDSVMSIDVCSLCHPFYTGKQKILDTAGQVDKFKKRYSKT